MKQNALHSFSASALRKSSSSLHKPLLVLMLIYTVYGGSLAGGVWLLSLYAFEALPVLIWCGVRFFMRIILAASSAGRRAVIISECTGMLSLPCGYFRSARRRLRRLYALRGLLRFLLRIPAAAGLIGAVWLLYGASKQADGLYYLFGAAQIIPFYIILFVLKLRLEAAFSAAEVLCVRQPEISAFANLRTAFAMLRGQYLLIAGIFLRSGIWLLLPVTQPKFIVTLVSYFSVRCLEWQYHRQKGAECSREQTGVYRRYRKPHEAGGISAA